MPPFCFSCERERSREFVCRACGERECAVCGDAESKLCEACGFELQSAAALQRFFEQPATGRGDDRALEPEPRARAAASAAR